MMCKPSSASPQQPAPIAAHTQANPAALESLEAAQSQRLIQQLRGQLAELEQQNAELRGEQALLLKRERFFHELADQIPALVSYWTPDLRCAFANRGYLDWFARSAEQMQGMHMQELHGAQLFEQNLPYVRAVLSGAPQRFERTLSRPDGSTVHLLAQYIAHRLDGQVQGFFALISDISSIRQGQEQLHIREERLRAMVDAEPSCVKIVDAAGRLLEMNAAGLQMLKADSLAAVQARGLLAFVQPAYRAAFTDLHRRVMAGANGFLLFEIIALDGTHRWLESHAVPLRDDSGQVTSLLAVTLDMSSSRQAQLALQDSESRWRFAIEGSGDGLWDWDIPAGRVFFSARWKTMLGFSEADIGNTLEEWSARVHPEDLAQAMHDLHAHLDGHSEYYLNEHRVSCKDGRWKWILARGLVVRRDASGQVLRMIGTYTDIDERKQVQQQVQASLHEKEALLKEVHHRVKNNLQVITSLLRLEIRRSDQVATKTVLDEMQNRIRSMSLLHEVLYRSGTFAALNLGDYLRQVATQGVRAQQRNADAIELQLQLAAIPVNLDQAMPCGLLLNELISNCFKHAFPDGRAGLVVVELQLLDERGKVRLCVSDNGVGLPANVAAPSPPGIGLQLASDLAGQLGGQLEIGAGPGGCFSVIFTVQALLISPSAG